MPYALAMTDRPGPLTRRDLPPGPGHPRTVQTARWLLDGPRLMRRCQRRFGDVFTLDLIPTLVGGPLAGRGRGADGVFVRSRAHQPGVQDRPGVVLTGETNMFLPNVVGPESILMLDKPAHMRQPRLMLPPLRGAHVQQYQELMAHATPREITSWPVGRPHALCPPGFGLDCSPPPQSQDC
jgi:cytochrome P450 family 135